MRKGAKLRQETLAWLRAYNERTARNRSRRSHRPVVNVAAEEPGVSIPSPEEVHAPTAPPVPSEVPIPQPEDPPPSEGTAPPPPPAPEVVSEPAPPIGPQGIERPMVQFIAGALQGFVWAAQERAQKNGLPCLPVHPKVQEFTQETFLRAVDMHLPVGAANLRPDILAAGLLVGAGLQNLFSQAKEDEQKQAEAKKPAATPPPPPPDGAPVPDPLVGGEIQAAA